jgi:hypothetical protein
VQWASPVQATRTVDAESFVGEKKLGRNRPRDGRWADFFKAPVRPMRG